MNTDQALNEVVQALAELAEPILVVAHPRPDGDAVGSVVAMTRYLNLTGKSAIGFIPDVPPHLQFAAKDIQTEQPTEFSSVVMVDTTQRDRTPLTAEDFDGKQTVNIDHHADNKCEADAKWVDTTASSAGEMVQIIAADLEDAQIAEACYLGMRTDTGDFAFPNTTDKTLMLAAECVSQGADTVKICAELAKRTQDEVQLLGLALTYTTWNEAGTVCYTILSQNEIDWVKDPNMQPAMVALRSVIGTEACIALTENPDGSWRGSIRCTERMTVNDVAAHYGGGGHPQAAGFRIDAGTDIESILTEAKRIVHKLETKIANLSAES